MRHNHRQTTGPLDRGRGTRGFCGGSGRLLISAVVISEIGDLAVGAGAGERGCLGQTVIHPHSKNIQIHASREILARRAPTNYRMKCHAREYRRARTITTHVGSIGVKLFSRR